MQEYEIASPKGKNDWKEVQLIYLWLANND